MARDLPPIGPLAALQFLTRVPISLRSAPDMGKTVAWFPMAGAFIGAAVGGVAAGLWHVLPPLPAAAITVAFGLLLTGAFHEDGLGDIADAFGGGVTIERRLEILKDSRHGTYGVAAMCSSIVVRIACLSSMTSPLRAFVACVVAHSMARAAAVGLAAAGPMSTHPGLGADAGRATTPGRAVFGIAPVLALCAGATAWWSPWIVVATVAVSIGAALTTAALAYRKVGGISGDVLGACEQVAEGAIFAVFSAFVGA